ncbi:sensor histidine kinase [Nonomuraea sp. NPDC050394]|uniref:sensor histidine kinase n=1 Tax=Nonomuraea sp. NPDC050394 TaxID=3364363 RepID=UPI0037883507
MKVMPRSVRGRVTLAATFAAAIALGAAAAILAMTIPRTLEAQLASRVNQAVQAQAADARRGDLPADLSTPPGIDLLQVIAADGAVLGTSTQAGDQNRFAALPTPPPERLTTTYGRPDLPEASEEYYIAFLRTTTPSGPITVYGAEDVSATRQAIRLLYFTLAVALPALLFMVGLAAWTAVGQALRPVKRIRTQLATITAGDLGRRVTVPGTGDEIAALATATNDTLTRLERSAETQRHFVSDASHELRSPITALRTQLELAVADPADTDWPEVGARSLDAVDRLSGIIDELLLMARLDAGAVPDRKRVDLGELARAQAARRAGVRADVADGAFVDGSPIQLDRLLTNLLDNAERHARSRVGLSVAVDGGEVVLTVTDDGNGIAPQDRERVFERFTRLREGRERDQGGSGLGLALSRQIAEVHGGSLAITDHEPGAQFRAVFPLAP